MKSSSGNQSSGYLKAKIKIGSCKGPVNYNQSQAVFHHDDIPEKARARASDVKEWASSKLLTLDRNEWKKSTDPNVPLCERRSMENFERDRSKKYEYNYRSESLDSMQSNELIDKPTKFHISRQSENDLYKLLNKMKDDPVSRGQYKRLQEMPVHPKLADAVAWSTSSRLLSSEQQASLDAKTVKARAATAKTGLRYLNNYLSPMEQTKHLQKILRQKKEEGSFKVENGIVTLEVEESEDPNRFVNRQAVEKSKKYKTDKHSGVWEFNKLEKKHMWSDTGSFIYNSKGDIIISHNPDAYNLSGPTSM